MTLFAASGRAYAWDIGTKPRVKGDTHGIVDRFRYWHHPAGLPCRSHSIGHVARRWRGGDERGQGGGRAQTTGDQEPALPTANGGTRQRLHLDRPTRHGRPGWRRAVQRLGLQRDAAGTVVPG